MDSEGMQLQEILLLAGAVGIALVLMFAISMGISNSTLAIPKIGRNADVDDNDNCPASRDTIRIPKYKKQASPTYHLSNLLSAGTCPTGYTHFADAHGNSLCCGSSNIDVFSHTCSATGPDGVCSMVPGIEDERQISGDVRFYPVCQEIILQQQMAASGQLCPRKFPTHVNIPASHGLYKCCRGAANSSNTDCAGGASCAGLIGGQNMFNTPDSCETDRLLEKLTCPPGTNMVEKLHGTSVRTKDLSIPVCVGVKGNCIDKKALDELRALGYFQDINPEKNIMNCDVYQKVYNERIWSQSQAEMKHSKDLE
jgi:hypothetical protein